MKKECDIVKDLLPLYEEDMLSEASNEYVEKHLRECQDCQSDDDIIIVKENKEDSGIEEIKSISSKIKKHYLNVGLLVLMILAISTTIIFSALSTPKYFSSSNEKNEVIEKNGQVVIQFNPDVTRYSLSSFEIEGGAYDYSIGVYYTKLDQLLKKGNLEPIVLNVNDEKVHFVYQYSPHDTPDAIIYGDPSTYNGGLVSLGRLAQNYYL